MQTMIKFSRPSARSTAQSAATIEEIIRNELYPEEKFPHKNFPNLVTILVEFLGDYIRTHEELRKLYNNDRNNPRFIIEARQLLNFRNLLLHHPQLVVLIYREYIEKFIYFKHRSSEDREDIYQEVITRLMEDKIYKIQKKYDFDFQVYTEEENRENLKKISTFTSYLMVTVRNIYIDIIRERNVRPLTAGELQEIGEVPDLQGEGKMISKLLLSEELAKLKTIFVMFYKSRPKLELCLKLKFRIPVSGGDVRQCFPDCSPQDSRILEQDFSQSKDKKVFETILPVFNRQEGRENKSDTLRKWINVKVDEIIAQLNRSHESNVYNNKNFADFVAFYYRDIAGDGRQNLLINTG